MVSAMVYGPFSNIADAYLLFAVWLQKNQLHYAIGGQSRQIVHRSQWNEDVTSNYFVEIQIQLVKLSK